MIFWTLAFLVVALIAGFFGFGFVASAAGGIAQLIFFIFIVLFLVSLLNRPMRRS